MIALDAGVPEFQRRVDAWVQGTFGPALAGDAAVRNAHFLEEALELVQANGCTKDQALALVHYVFDRPVGEVAQELGGVMVTLAAFCNALHLSMMREGQRELERIDTAEMVEAIRRKKGSASI
jgi:hypothetical protein